MPKTMIFSFDGTGNEPGDAANYQEDESISNILKLHLLLGGGFKEDGTETTTPAGEPQTTYYYNGIGTRGGDWSLPLVGSLVTMAKRVMNQAIAPTWSDVRSILEEAQEDFRKANYERGDRLVVFGYSRGAALARKFVARLLGDNRECEVSFLGVFDTVAAMDGVHRAGETVGSDVVFENGTLHPQIRKAVHILSLDEDRIPFTPTLINQDEGNADRVLEIWFPGVHGDIGGGYWHDGLSDLALAFMMEQCKAVLGPSIGFVEGKDNQAISAALQAQGDALAGVDVDDIAVHPMVHGECHAHSGLLAKVGKQAPRQVCVWRNDRPVDEPPLVHVSVRERFRQVGNYRPPALRGVRFKLYRRKPGRKPVRGISGLRQERVRVWARKHR